MCQMLNIQQMRCALRAGLGFPWAVPRDPQSRLSGATTITIFKGHLGEMSPLMGTWAFLLTISTTKIADLGERSIFLIAGFFILY